MLIENLVLGGVEPRGGHFCCHGNSNRIANALAERPRRAFHSGRVTKFGMARRFGMQLPEPFDLRRRHIVTAHVQPGVKEHAAVPAGEDEDIAIDPARLVWVVSQRIPEEYCAYFSATERQ